MSAKNATARRKSRLSESGLRDSSRGSSNRNEGGHDPRACFAWIQGAPQFRIFASVESTDDRENAVNLASGVKKLRNSASSSF